MRLSRFCSSSLLAALVACSSDSVLGSSGRFDHAAATFACGPADGPAVAIYLAADPITSVEPAEPFVRVYSPGTIDELSGKILSIDSEAGGWFHPTPNEYEIATSGYLMINAGSDGNVVDGLVDLQFPKAGHVHHSFHAEWIPSRGLCG